MIKSFACTDTEALSKGERVRRFLSIAAVAQRKLRQLQIAGRLNDLRVPPGNRLESLVGDRKGQHSIRVNDQCRDLIEQIDIRATVLDVANIPVPSWLEGRSLVPLMQGKSHPLRPLFSINVELNP